MITIRRITETDFPAYAEMANAFYQTDAVMAPIPMENFRRCFEEMLRDDTYAAAWMFLYNGETAGYAQIARTYSQEAGGRVIWVEELYVKEQYRSHGIGRAFFRLLEETYPDTARFRLEVEEENEGAVRLYKSLGYRFIPYQQMIKE